jgi:hypothetical protein
MTQARSSSIRALMWDTRRSSDRHVVERLSTLRSGDAPSDVTIDDLSLTGFRMSGVHGLNEGDLIKIGLAGVGVREATVIWLGDGVAGCSFSDPIMQLEFERTISANTVVDAQFRADSVIPVEFDERGDEDQVKSGRHGLKIFVAATVISWAGIVALGYAIFSFLR